MYFLICATVLLVLFIYLLTKTDPKPLLGVYSRPGKWYYVKYVTFACMYYYRKYSKKNEAAGPTDRAGQGVKALVDAADMDRPQALSDDAKTRYGILSFSPKWQESKIEQRYTAPVEINNAPPKKAFDAVFFISAMEEAEKGKGIYVIAGCERRPMGMCNGLFYIGMPSKGLLCSMKIPDTVLFGAPIGEFAAEGLKIASVTPMKKWTVAYKGQMWYQNDPQKLVDVEFTGEWTATSRYFDYDTELHPPAIIRSIAREPWSRKYFEHLKTAHQSHYEQFGSMKCKFSIEGEMFDLTLPSFRDHSFGKRRDWTLMHRYIFHHIFLRNGISISVGVISQPSTASMMEAGVVNLPNGDMLPVEWVDLELYQHGEGGTPPKDYAFRLKAGDEVYTVQVLVEYESVHYVSEDWEARMVERFCKFIVNGVPGRGVNEFHYRRTDGRPDSVGKDDPEWYRKMRHKV